MSAIAAVKIDIDTSGALRKLREVDKAAKNFNSTVGKTNSQTKTAKGTVGGLGSSFGALTAKIAAASGAFIFLNRSLATMSEREADVNVLSHSLQGLVANAGKATKELTEAADRLGNLTLFSQEDFTQSFNMLTSFRTIGVDSYERVATAAADMGTKLGTDVRGNMLQLAKALEAPEVGLTALRRSGTRFTEQQTEMIKKLVKSGELLQAQEVILKEIEKQYGGAAVAAGQTFAGAMDQLNEEFRDFMEVVGKSLVPVLTPMVKGLTAMLEVITKIPMPLLQVVAGIAGGAGLAVAVIGLGKALIFLKAKIIGVNIALAANPFVLLAMGIGAATVAIYRAATAHQRFRQEVLTGTKTIEEANAELEKLRKQYAELEKLKKRQNTQQRRKSGVEAKMAKVDAAIKGLEGAITDVTQKVDTGLNTSLTNTANISQQLGQTIRSGIVDAIEGAITGAQSLGDVLSGVLKQIGRMYLTAGVNQLKLPGLPMAEGGFVSGPTPALIGEGGEGEYVIPESKMNDAMNRYAAGARGDSVIAGGGGGDGEGGGSVGGSSGAIDVTFNTQVINDVSYVSYAEFQAGVQQAAAQGAKRGEQATLRRLQTSPTTRRRIGV